MRLTKAQREQDELILAAIIAGAETCGRKVLPHNTHDGVQGSGNGYGTHRSDVETQGPCCAVGAGILYAGIESTTDPTLAFAQKYGVSREYAIYVSSGFEHGYGGNDLEGESEDAHRGRAVGRAAFDALCLPPEGGK